MLAATLALACAFLVQTVSAQADTVTLAPVADAWVSNDAPDTNHGSDPTLQTGGFNSPTDRRSYLRFRSGALPAGAVVTRTTLRLYFESASSSNFDVRLALTDATNTNWAETGVGGITWNNKPNVTGPTAGVGLITAGWNNVSVPLLTPDSPITYVLTRATTEGASIQSKENLNKPQLVVEYAMPETATTSVCSAAGCVESKPWVTTMSWGIVVADFNGDGREDHLISRHSSTQDQIQLQQPDGSFAPYTLPIPGPSGSPLGHFPPADRHGCTAGDVNGDHRTDLFCMQGGDGGETTGKSNELWIQQPDGSFAPNQAAAWGVNDQFGRGRRPLLFDFDHIGTGDDLYITNFGPRLDGKRSENILFLNNNPNNMGPFVEKPDAASGNVGDQCLTPGDWDRDLFTDFLVCGSQLHLFHNDADNPNDPLAGRHTEQTDYLLGPQVDYPQDAKLADVNGDGWDDLIVITKTELQIRLDQGPGNPNPRFPVSFSTPLVDGNSVSVGDLTGDGFQDVYVVQGVVNGPDGPHNAPDKLFTGPNWTPLEVPQADTGTGDDSAFINVLGRQTLIVTNGRDYARGPVQFLTFSPVGYPRPKGATPIRASLVPAYSKCSAPTSTHGAPLAYGACAPPVQLSHQATVGTPDANGRAANSIGSVDLNVIPGDPSTPADEADLALRASITDVRNKSDLADYTAELQATVDVRITDRNNGGPSGSDAATLIDTPFSFTVPCTATPSTMVGSTCATATTADALVPNTIREKQRGVWQLGQIQVFDGGDDGLVSTSADNTLFATQGVFVP